MHGAAGTDDEHGDMFPLGTRARFVRLWPEGSTLGDRIKKPPHHRYYKLTFQTGIGRLNPLEDPRIARSKHHSLYDLPILSVCALLCRAEGFADMDECGKAQRECPGRLLELAVCIVFLDAIRCQKIIAAWDHRYLVKLLSI